MWFLIMVCGIPFAFYRSLAFSLIFTSLLVNLVFLVLAVAHVNSLEKVKTFLLVAWISSIFLSVTALDRALVSGDSRYIYSTMFDSNDMAYILVSLVPLSVFYIVYRKGVVNSVFAAVSIISSIGAILLSGSRAGLIGLLSILGVFMLTRMAMVKRGSKWGFIVFIVIISVYYLPRIDTERYLTLLDLGGDYNVTAETGRFQIWRRALELTLSNPLTGVGVGCFPMAIGYVRKSLHKVPRWQQVHNSYLQVAVEVGLGGFIIFIALVGGCIKNFSACRRLGGLSRDIRELRTIAGLLLLGFIGHLVTAFFLSQAYSVLFTLFIAFSAILHRVKDQVDVTTAIGKKERRVSSPHGSIGFPPGVRSPRPSHALRVGSDC